MVEKKETKNRSIRKVRLDDRVQGEELRARADCCCCSFLELLRAGGNLGGWDHQTVIRCLPTWAD